VHPAAMQLRLLGGLVDVAEQPNSTIVFPVPMELLRLVDAARATHESRAGNG
jgi:hypothetical protein